jgi:hypothetical protein
MTGSVSFERPPRARVLREFAGHIDAQPDRVFALLVARVNPRGDAHVLSDPATRRAVVQGDYWYRGEYLVEPDAAGARVAHTIVNVAPGSRLLGALTGRQVLRSAPREFARLLGDLGRG